MVIKNLNDKEMVIYGMNKYKSELLDRLTQKGCLTADVSLEMLQVAREFVTEVFNNEE